jgi:hypothetical protein
VNEATELAQHLDAAYAAYKRKVGREQAIARLEHMLDRDAEAQRVMDAGKERMGSSLPRAAE